MAEADVLVPPGLEIRTSSNPRGGLGIFARCVIPKHEFFGPYTGKKILASEATTNYKDVQYVWEVRIVKNHYIQPSFFLLFPVIPSFLLSIAFEGQEQIYM